MTTVDFNGRTYVGEHSVIVREGRVFIDGLEVHPDTGVPLAVQPTRRREFWRGFRDGWTLGPLWRWLSGDPHPWRIPSPFSRRSKIRP